MTGIQNYSADLLMRGGNRSTAYFLSYLSYKNPETDVNGCNCDIRVEHGGYDIGSRPAWVLRRSRADANDRERLDLWEVR
jgi:hypothetical protein